MPVRVLAEGDEYIVKLRGAGQGVRALAVEVIVAELAEAVGLRVPARAIVEIPPGFVLNRDHELVELMERSVGENLGFRWLNAGPLGDVNPELAAKIALFDAFLMNVDRRAKNPNLLRSSGDVYLIDHGAVLLFEHTPDDPALRDRVVYEHLFRARGALQLTDDDLTRAVAAVPRAWLSDPQPFLDVLRARLAAVPEWSSRLHIGHIREGGREASRIRGTMELLGESIDLARRAGLHDVDIAHELLRPGRRSASPHAHTKREELVYVLRGTPTLVLEGSRSLLRPGDYVGFRSGDRARHHLRNDTTEDVEYLVIASKPDGDEVVY